MRQGDVYGERLCSCEGVCGELKILTRYLSPSHTHNSAASRWQHFTESTQAERCPLVGFLREQRAKVRLLGVLIGGLFVGG